MWWQLMLLLFLGLLLLLLLLLLLGRFPWRLRHWEGSLRRRRYGWRGFGRGLGRFVRVAAETKAMVRPRFLFG